MPAGAPTPRRPRPVRPPRRSGWLGAALGGALLLAACATARANPTAVPAPTVPAQSAAAATSPTHTPSAAASATAAPGPANPAAAGPLATGPAAPTSAAAQAAKPAAAAAGPATPVTVVEPPFRPPQEWRYEPARTTVKVGSRITWTNKGAVLHTATADDGKTFDSGNLGPGQSWDWTPTQAGTIAYHCTQHVWMKGTIAVTP